MNRVRVNFFDDDYADAGVAPREEEEAYETIYVHSDDEPESSAPPAAATPSLDVLRTGVAQAEAEVQRVNLLMVRLVWKLLTDKRSTHPVPDPHRGRPPRPLVGSRHHTTLSSSADFEDWLAVHSDGNRRQSRSTALANTKPFLPPSRHPVVPPLDPSQHARFNRILFQAVVEANRTGVLETATPPPSASSAALPSRSLRATALEKVVCQPPAHSLQRCRQRSRSSEPPKGANLVSVSLIILQLAQKRCLMTLYLRVLQVHIHERRTLHQELELRFQYYRQRRVLRSWWGFTQTENHRRDLMTLQVLRHWEAYVAHRLQLKRQLEAFCEGLCRRRAAYARCEQGRLRRYWGRWQNLFMLGRHQRSMGHAADAFRAVRAARQPRQATVARVVDHLTNAPSLWRAFAYWTSATRRRTAWRAAQEHYKATLKLRVWRRVRALLPDCVGRYRDREAQRIAAAPAEDPVVLSCVRRVAVAALPAGLAKYKNNCARRVSQGAILSRTFRWWRERFRSRQAGRFYRQHGRVAAVRQWLQRLAHRRQQHETRRAMWYVWVDRYRDRQWRRGAVAISAHCLLRATLQRWYLRWTAAAGARQGCLLFCVRQWRDRAAVRSTQRVLAASKHLRLWHRWRQRTELQVYRRTTWVVADTVRETILLLHCVRWWCRRTSQARTLRLSAEVLEGLSQERSLRLCFHKWRRRAVGPLPLPLSGVQAALRIR